MRIKKGMTQEELADKTELSARTIQRIEKGEVDPRAYTLRMIAKALEADFSLFVNDTSGNFQEIRKTNNAVWISLLHLSGILPLIFPTVIIRNMKKEEIPDDSEDFRAAVTFQFCILGISLFR